MWRPKSSVGGAALPSPRLLSINLVPDVDAPSELDTHNLMQWGQFVDHDITHTPLYRLSNPESSGIQCCLPDGSGPISKLSFHPECFPIEIPDNDPFFSKGTVNIALNPLSYRIKFLILPYISPRYQY